MKILIGADLVPTKSNEELFVNADIEKLVGFDLLDILKKHDFRIFNLETPLCDKLNPIVKCGPNLSAKTSTVNGIKKLNVDLLSLANNHILDQNEAGLKSTMKVLTENSINYVGVGDLFSANKPYFIYDGKKRICIYSCAENEFSIVSKNNIGANPFDVYKTYDDIKMLKNESDYLIVLYHGGKEFYRYPSPMLQIRCRKMIENGADLVVTQHSHCIGCNEEYLNGKIVYGQGNFIFDLADNEYWKTSILLSVDVDSNDIQYIPIVKKAELVRLADIDEKNKILSDFYERSRLIMNSEFVEEEYKKFAVANISNYICASKGKTLFGKVMNKITKGYYFKIKAKFYGKKQAVILYNYLKCEAHYELFITALENKINK